MCWCRTGRAEWGGGGAIKAKRVCRLVLPDGGWGADPVKHQPIFFGPQRHAAACFKPLAGAMSFSKRRNGGKMPPFSREVVQVHVVREEC